MTDWDCYVVLYPSYLFVTLASITSLFIASSGMLLTRSIYLLASTFKLPIVIALKVIVAWDKTSASVGVRPAQLLHIIISGQLGADGVSPCWSILVFPCCITAHILRVLQ